MSILYTMIMKNNTPTEYQEYFHNLKHFTGPLFYQHIFITAVILYHWLFLHEIGKLHNTSHHNPLLLNGCTVFH